MEETIIRVHHHFIFQFLFMACWSELDAFLKEHAYAYINDSGVLFSRVAPGFMFVDCDYPDYSGPYDVRVVFLCADPDEFFEKLQIEEPGALSQVTPEVLLQLFDTGDAMVVCAVDEDNSLEFEKRSDELLAGPGDGDLMYEVQKQLIRPEDFIDYTREYFRKENKVSFYQN